MDFDYAFEMANSNIRYGYGVTKEIGAEMKSLNAQNVLVVTDPKVFGNQNKINIKTKTQNKNKNNNNNNKK